MKLNFPKNWIKKFRNDPADEPDFEIAGDIRLLCGCGNPIESGGFCAECIDGYRGEDS